jgi:hypothetical protein
LDIREVGGDKAYDANYNYRYAREHGIDAHIKIRRGHDPTKSYHGNKYRKRQVESQRVDPEGFAARANRRSNAETGNHAFKAILGDQIYSKNPAAQRNEILCMCIAYNLTRLVYLAVDRHISLDFAAGARELATKRWVNLDTLKRQHPAPESVRREWRP